MAQGVFKPRPKVRYASQCRSVDRRPGVTRRRTDVHGLLSLFSTIRQPLTRPAAEVAVEGKKQIERRQLYGAVVASEKQTNVAILQRAMVPSDRLCLQVQPPPLLALTPSIPS
jgi:hypothetical protein